MNNVSIWLVFGDVQTLTLTGSIFLRLTHRVIGFLHFEDNTWYLYLLTLKPSHFHAHSAPLFPLTSLFVFFLVLFLNFAAFSVFFRFRTWDRPDGAGNAPFVPSVYEAGKTVVEKEA